MNSIQTFNFQSQFVRVEFKNGEPLFCLVDVAQILEIKNTKSSRFNLKEDGVHKMYLTDKLGRNQEATFISEPNLYRVIFRSNKPEAVKFQDWIFEEVIPQIRKTGSYSSVQPKPTKPVAGGLLPEQIEAVKKLHNTLVAAVPKEKQAALAVMLWSAVKSKFGCSYKSIPPEHFVEVLSVMSRAAVADSSGEALPRLPRQYFELLAKMTLYADHYQKMQHLLCTAQGTPESEALWTGLTSATAPDQSGYLFVFRPNLKEDVQQAFNWLHQQSQALLC